MASVTACATDPDEGDVEWEEDCGGKCDDASAGVAPLNAPDLLVNDLAVLGQLERAGFDLGGRLGGSSMNNAMLATSSPVFRQLADVIGTDMTQIAAQDPTARVGLSSSHRLFDTSWLRAASARFRLVAVTNRTDRHGATPGACGEVRFVYRLMYTAPSGSSRLPMTLLVVHEQPTQQGGCAAVARSWLGQTSTADKLRAGPLAGLGPAVRIELNLQAVRWPAGARGDLGGHAEYLMRVFRIAGTTLSAIKLPNTIATTLSTAQKAALKQWIVTNAANIDAGSAQVPDEYLATKAISVSPRGLARGANRPFLQAFPEPETTFAAVDFSRLSLVKSPGGLVRRLDTMSCQGCHQSRGLAGFHILGQDDAETSRANAIERDTRVPPPLRLGECLR